jgi:tryptophan synthase beta chain
MKQKKILLDENEMPTQWYNVMPDIPNGIDPPLDPETKQPMGPEKLAAVFPMGLLEQEMSDKSWIDIPEEVQEIYHIWRPTPLVRAYALEAALGTKAKIYYKNESVSPSGSHKTNSSVAQAYYNKREGVKRLSTETGAGQWGSALAFATHKFGLECKVYMVRVSFDQKPYRKIMMNTYGADIVASPSPDTAFGHKILENMPGTAGRSLGIAISEALEDAATRDDTKYALGSVLNHIILHQSIIGLETKKQLAKIGAYPDVVIGCCGGGSNYAGGLRYHGMSPIISALVREKLIEPMSVHQLECFEAGRLFAQTEGIIPAPETCHAIRATIIEATRDLNDPQTALFNFSRPWASRPVKL